jgi:hypothetical protein
LTKDETFSAYYPHKNRGLAMDVFIGKNSEKTFGELKNISFFFILVAFLISYGFCRTSSRVQLKRAKKGELPYFFCPLKTL